MVASASAGVIVLLYAQPLSRLVRLTVDDVTRDCDQVLLRLGEPPSPVPAPVADLLLDWISKRDNMNTATNPNSRWLFPGRRAGQPMHPQSLADLLNELDIPVSTGRTAAIRQHVLEMPPPVVADALGYHPVTTTTLAAQAGATWSRYAPVITHGHMRRELATVEYATSPVPDPEPVGYHPMQPQFTHSNPSECLPRSVRISPYWVFETFLISDMPARGFVAPSCWLLGLAQ